VRLAGQYGQRTRGGEFSFTEPYFMDTRVAAGFDIFAKQTLRSDFNPVDSLTMGGTLRAGLPLREDVTLGLRYTLFQRELKADPGLIDGCTNVPATCPGPGGGTDTNELSNAYQQQLGKALTSQIGYTLTYNTLDDIRNPARGNYATLNQDFAGLGGDVKLIRTTAEARTYYPITNDLTGMFRVQGGHVWGWGGDLRVLDHFFQGPDLVRGFAPSGLGPRDLGSTEKDALGGSLYWGTTAELIFPFPLLSKDFGLKAAIFADAGSVWGYDGTTTFGIAPATCPTGSTLNGTICLADSNSVRASVGASIIWASPFGPLRFDFAYALLKEPWDKTQFLRFGAGGKF
jgi:outer membrane protein insertion porin family